MTKVLDSAKNEMIAKLVMDWVRVVCNEEEQMPALLQGTLFIVPKLHKVDQKRFYPKARS